MAHHNGSGHLTSTTRLSEHSVHVLNLRLAHARGHSEVDASQRRCIMREIDPRTWSGHQPPVERGHTRTMSSHNLRASATRAL
jgi:hypothetical protein